MPVTRADSISSADSAAAFTPGCRLTKSLRELTRKGLITGSVSLAVCRVTGVFEIVSCR